MKFNANGSNVNANVDFREICTLALLYYYELEYPRACASKIYVYVSIRAI